MSALTSSASLGQEARKPGDYSDRHPQGGRSRVSAGSAGRRAAEPSNAAEDTPKSTVCAAWVVAGEFSVLSTATAARAAQPPMIAPPRRIFPTVSQCSRDRPDRSPDGNGDARCFSRQICNRRLASPGHSASRLSLLYEFYYLGLNPIESHVVGVGVLANDAPYSFVDGEPIDDAGVISTRI